ncbi:hypothetical protein ACFV4F_03380 [Kitasatospora sp. NPDC059722]|uniref:hypothetical protein n=1 Tax=Kitasatospora sp. NPDC059722 TaxID=3346925 RepID=UPI00368F7BB6
MVENLNLTNLPTDTPPPAPRTDRPKTPKSRAQQGVPLDWAAPHGPITGALSAATGAGAVALLGAAAGMPEVLPLAVGAAGAIGHGVGWSVRRRLTAMTVVTRSASWLLAGGWTTWAIHTGPLSWAAAGTLAGLGVGIGAMASTAAVHEEAAEEERLALTPQATKAADALDQRRRAIAREWEERIARVAGVQATVFAVQFWKTGGGFSLAAELPGGTATWDQIAARARALAGDAKLPLGCVIAVEEGDIQGRVVLDVPTVNGMADSHDYPTDYSPLSILTGIPWGMLPTLDPVKVYLREACALLLGPPGSGKSTLVDGVLTGFARCTDVITWVIDLKAGAVGIPWMRPWLEATGRKTPKAGTEPAPKDTRPGVDWIASTPEEALRMMTAALRINAARQQHYQDLLDSEDTTLLPVSAKLPQIMVVVDEGAELLSIQPTAPKVLKDLREAVRKAMRTTRAMGIRFVLTAVDGNVSALGDTEVRKFSPVGAALTSGESAGNNLVKMFPRAKVDTRQLNAKGSGVIGASGEGGFAPTPFKTWRTSPSQVRAAVLATNHIRPALDAVSAQAIAEDYARRWDADRAGWLWANPTTATKPADPTPTGADTARPAERPGGLNLSFGNGSADLKAAREWFLKDRRPTGGGLNLSAARPAPASAADAFDDGPSVYEPAVDPAPELLVRAHAAITRDGSDRMFIADLAAALGADAQTLGSELNALMRAVGVERPGAGTVRIDGTTRAGFYADTLEEAVKRYRR